MIDMVFVANLSTAVIALALLCFVLACHIFWCMAPLGLHFVGTTPTGVHALTRSPCFSIFFAPLLRPRSRVFPDSVSIPANIFAPLILYFCLGILGSLFALQFFIIFFSVLARIVQQLFLMRCAIGAIAFLALFAQTLASRFATHKILGTFGFESETLGANFVAIWERHIVKRGAVSTCFALLSKAIFAVSISVKVSERDRLSFAALSTGFRFQENASCQLGVSTFA